MLDLKLEKLLKLLQDMESVVICFSGGTDSSFLAMAASKVLTSDKFLLVHAASVLVPRSESAFVDVWTAENHLPLKILHPNPLTNKDIVKNDPQRCYYCKKFIMESVCAEAEKNGFNYVLDGLNRDDLEDYRPGTRAADERGVRHPLLEAGLNKAEIRILSDHWGIPNWNTPASACLASRVPYGMELTPEILEMVDRAEEFLRQLGYHGCRVRYLNDAAKIELQQEDFVSAAENAELIVADLRKIGFKNVFLDLFGYVRGGGQNPE